MMKTAVRSTSPIRGGELRFSLVFAAMYPLFLTASAIQRLAAQVIAGGASRSGVEQSVFVEARENALIAITYTTMARTTLQIFARKNRAERLS
jgi:hypothetical protein